MANTIDWGKATQNNTNGFGKYQNTIGAASVYADSWAGETAIVGTSAAFSYSKSSYHQGEADPTPTITGTTGGSFVCTSGAVFVDTGSTSSSTGQIDLDASTLNTHLISYTVDGVTATANVGITASPFIANTFSMQFDSASSQYIQAGNNLLGSTFTISMWFNADSYPSTNPALISQFSSGLSGRFFIGVRDNGGRKITAFLNAHNYGSTVINTGAWYHLALVNNNNTATLYLNGSVDGNFTFPTSVVNTDTLIGTLSPTSNHWNGKIDEVAIWNAALSSDAITEIYNATNNNSGKALDLSTDSGNYSSSSNLQYFNRMGD